LNHPVRVIPSVLVSIPADWPTDNHGAITCLTCHSEIPGIGAESNPRLRDLDGGYTSGADFCGRCHRIVDEGSARSVHWLALRRAHLGVDSASAVKGGRALDHYSQACLTCHDGVNASESANAARFGGMHADLGDKGKNHPVGVPYRSVDRPSYLSRLRPASLLPTEVALPGGDVSCISCHDLFGDQQHLLTVPIEGSQLCLTCHEMS
jgi:predicted CXXCH cytochrome family protein